MIHYLTVATEEKQYLPYLKQLLPELVILGMNTKWEGWIYRFKLVIEYTKTIDDNDIICFIDAYDVLPTKKISNLENNFKKFREMNTNVKMVIGYDLVENVLIEKMEEKWFGSFNNNRLNAGSYIGYSKDINHILTYIVTNNPNMDLDQTELTKYANEFQNDIYIDTEKLFFNIVTKPLEYIQTNNYNYDYGFIHANGNGFLNDFLYDHHNIKIDPIENLSIHIGNYYDFLKKWSTYSNYI
jgi:hypothetical protein